MLLYAFGIFKISSVVCAKISNRKLIFLKMVLSAILFIITVEHANPIEAYHISQRKYGEKVNPMFAPSTSFKILADYKSTGEYVARQLRRDDIVVFLGFAKTTFYYYIGRIDYSLDLNRDIFIEKNTPQAHKHTGNGTIGLPQLKKFIVSGRRVWLVVSLISQNFRDESSCVDAKNKLIEDNRKNLVFESSDNAFLVYKFN
jgi:hypothetical protein